MQIGFFYSEVFTLYKSRGWATLGRYLQSKRNSLYEHMWKITANPKLEQVKILVIGKHLANQFHQAVICRKKLYEWNLDLADGLQRMVSYYVSGMVSPRHEG